MNNTPESHAQERAYKLAMLAATMDQASAAEQPERSVRKAAELLRLAEHYLAEHP